MFMTRQEIFDQIWIRTVQGFAEDYELNYPRTLKLLKESNIPKPSRKELMLLKKGEDGWLMVKKPDLPGDPQEEVKLPRRMDAEPVYGEDKEPKRKSPKRKKKEEGVPWRDDYPETEDPRWQSLYFLQPEERRHVLQEMDLIERPGKKLRHTTTQRLQQEIEAYRAQVEIVEDEPELLKALKHPDFLDRVAPESVDRVLWLLDRIYLSLDRLGCTILENGGVRIHNQDILLKFTESKARAERRPSVLEEMGGAPKGPKWTYEYTGKLTLSLGQLFSVRDRKYDRLEDRLGEILELLFRTAYQLSLSSDRQRIAEEAQKESYNLEMERTEQLLQQAKDYESALQIRQLIKVVQKRVTSGSNAFQLEFPEWAAWASQKADWLDPTMDVEDAILGRRHEAILQKKQKAK